MLDGDVQFDLLCIAYAVLGGEQNESLQRLFEQFREMTSATVASLGIRQRYVIENLETLKQAGFAKTKSTKQVVVKCFASLFGIVQSRVPVQYVWFNEDAM